MKNERYYLLYDGEQPIAGILKRPAQRSKTETALWIGNIATDNIELSVKKAAENNATVVVQSHDFALYGKRAVIADPQGGVIAFIDLSNTDQAQQKISQKWDWAQLFSIDTLKAASFYQNTFDYVVDEVEHSKHSYYLSQQDEVRASVVKLPSSFEQRDRWVNFIEVADLDDTLAKATQNGAETIYQPKDNRLAIIADPNGALLGLTEQEQD